MTKFGDMRKCAKLGKFGHLMASYLKGRPTEKLSNGWSKESFDVAEDNAENRL